MTLEDPINEAIALREKFGGETPVKLTYTSATGYRQTGDADVVKIRSEPTRCMEIST